MNFKKAIDKVPHPAGYTEFLKRSVNYLEICKVVAEFNKKFPDNIQDIIERYLEERIAEASQEK